MEQVGLRLHPDKTRMCTARTGSGAARTSTRRSRFWGTSSGSGGANKNGQKINAFLPAISKQALNRLGAEVRSWRLHHRTGRTFADLAGGSIRSCGAGCSTTGRSIALRCINSCRASTPTWCAGSARNTDDCAPRRKPSSAGGGLPHGIPGCSRTGHGFPRSHASVTRGKSGQGVRHPAAADDFQVGFRSLLREHMVALCERVDLLPGPLRKCSSTSTRCCARSTGTPNRAPPTAHQDRRQTDPAQGTVPAGHHDQHPRFGSDDRRTAAAAGGPTRARARAHVARRSAPPRRRSQRPDSGPGDSATAPRGGGRVCPTGRALLVGDDPQRRDRAGDRRHRLPTPGHRCAIPACPIYSRQAGAIDLACQVWIFA